MKYPTKKTVFGELLQLYRDEKDMNQTQLVNQLSKNGYSIAVSTLRAYESGKRNPPVEFIVYTAHCMGLNKVQEEGLLHACFLDQYLELIENYRYTSVQLAGKIKPARI